MTKDFTGYRVFSTSSCCSSLNGRLVDKTIRKAFLHDTESTLYIVKIKGVRGYQQLYEDEMIRS